MKQVRWSEHARFKLQLLSRHGVVIGPESVESIVKNSRQVEPGYKGRKIAEGRLDESRVLRVVYQESAATVTIITLYPGKRERYEKTKV